MINQVIKNSLYDQLNKLLVEQPEGWTTKFIQISKEIERMKDDEDMFQGQLPTIGAGDET